MSIVSGIVGALTSADSADKAQAQNAANTQLTNQTNLALAMASKGATIWYDTEGNPHISTGPRGNSNNPQAVLPYYMGTAESDLGTGAAGMAKAMQALYASNPSATMADYQKIVDSYSTQYGQVNQTAADIASGAMTGQMVAEGKPVWDTRLQGAQAKKNAALESLRDTLNSIDATQARRGFAGDSLGSNLVKFNARRGIATQGAEDLNTALLANALEKQGLQQQGRLLQVNNLSLPDQMASAALKRTGAAGSQLASNYNTALSPLSFFKVGGTQAQYTGMPTVQPVSALAGVASGVGNFNSGLGNAVANGYLSSLWGSGSGGGGYVNQKPVWSNVLGTST